MKKPPKGFNDFIALTHASKNEKELALLFDFLMTPEEKENFATRVSLIKELLKKQKTQRDIAEHLNISIAKITRGSNALKQLDEKMLERLEKFLL